MKEISFFKLSFHSYSFFPFPPNFFFGHCFPFSVVSFFGFHCDCAFIVFHFGAFIVLQSLSQSVFPATVFLFPFFVQFF